MISSMVGKTAEWMVAYALRRRVGRSLGALAENKINDNPLILCRGGERTYENWRIYIAAATVGVS